jgi:hypothetical protein
LADKRQKKANDLQMHGGMSPGSTWARGWKTKAGARLRRRTNARGIYLYSDDRDTLYRISALDTEDLVSYRRLAAREDPFGLATWRRKLANRDSDGAKRAKTAKAPAPTR